MAAPAARAPQSSPSRKAQLHQARASTLASMNSQESNIHHQEQQAARRSSQFGNRLQAATGTPLNIPTQTTKPKAATNAASSPTAQQPPSVFSQIKSNLARAKKPSVRGVMQAELQKSKDILQKEIKKKAKAAFKRGLIYVVDMIAAALDLGTVGVSMLIDFFIYVFTFMWLNLELFYGLKMRKGKDPFVSPISWDPIPMPIDPHAVILMGAIVAADVTIITVGMLMFFAGSCLILDFSTLLTDPLNFALSIAGNPSATCATGIINAIAG